MQTLAPMSALPMQDFQVATGQGSIYARCWTPATSLATASSPIVLFHDSLGSVELWRDFPERLAQATGSTVIAYDRLGFGRSDPFPGSLPVSFIRDEAQTTFRALREHLGLESFIALGHSVGGCMAVATAARYPDHCKGLITESAQAFVEERTLDGIRQAQRAFAEPGQVDRLKRYHGDKAAWVLSAWIDTWLSSTFADWRLDDDLRGVHCPLLALHGDNDEYGSVIHPQRIAELVAGPSASKVFAGCGHVPHKEMGDAVLATIAQWQAANATTLG